VVIGDTPYDAEAAFRRGHCGGGSPERWVFGRGVARSGLLCGRRRRLPLACRA
jgi:hypothetical protein